MKRKLRIRLSLSSSMFLFLLAFVSFASALEYIENQVYSLIRGIIFLVWGIIWCLLIYFDYIDEIME